MKKLRSYIIKICIVGLICSGLGVTVAQPVQASQSSRNFANWLQSVTKQAHLSNLEEKLAVLEQSHVDLHQFIEQASQIVSEHNGNFNLPVEPTESKRLPQILLIEWNQFQTGNAMTGVPPVPTVKPFATSQFHKSFTGSIAFFTKPVSSHLFSTATGLLCECRSGVQHAIDPMSSGIAIGAP